MTPNPHNSPPTGLDSEQEDNLLTPGDVAAIFKVDPKTVARWHRAGRIGAIRTPGGHRRFRESEVRAFLCADAPQRSRSSA